MTHNFAPDMSLMCHNYTFGTIERKKRDWTKKNIRIPAFLWIQHVICIHTNINSPETQHTLEEGKSSKRNVLGVWDSSLEAYWIFHKTYFFKISPKTSLNFNSSTLLMSYPTPPIFLPLRCARAFYGNNHFAYRCTYIIFLFKITR